MNRAAMVGIVGTTLLAGMLAASAPAASRLPNIVLIFTDDQGYSDVGCFGAEGWTTPNIDRLADQGVRLTSFYVAQAVCSASRAALLTGCYPNRIGILGALFPGNTHGINADETTLAELLKTRGYATGIVGKWHLGHLREFLPLQHGFDEYLGIPYSNDMWPVDFDGEAVKNKPEASRPKKIFYPPLPLIDGNRSVETLWTLEEQGDLIRRYTKRAVTFIEKHRDTPFFLYVPHSLPHVPLGTSETFQGTSEYGRYGEVITEIDGSVGQIVQALEDNGLTENTLVIFTSDNGPWKNFGTHAGTCRPLREGKGTMWEGGCRVPFVARWPGHIPAGSQSSALAATIDILPTVAEITGADLPEARIDGVSILSLLQGVEGATPRDHYVYYYGQQLQAVRQGPWKLLFPHKYRTYLGFEPGRNGWPGKTGTAECGWELYQLEQDIGETVDVAGEHPDIVARLKALGSAHRDELNANKRPAGQSAFTPLFNGNDLEGWVNINGGPDTWSVEDHLIRCSGQPISMLRTEKAYQNFILELEWRHLEPKGNSGVFVWGGAIPAPGAPFLKGVECQILDGREDDWYTSQGDVFPTWGATMTPIRDQPFREIPRPAGMRAYPTAARTRPSPEWNHYRITCVDGAIDLAVNGEVVTRGTNGSPRMGYIALESEGAPVDFRNLRIQELPGAPLDASEVAEETRGEVSLFNGTDLTGWRTENPEHWQAHGTVITHDGQRNETGDPHLWTTRSFQDFELTVDWRFPLDPNQPDLPRQERPLFNPDGSDRLTPDGEPMVEEVVDVDSGIYLRGDPKSQVNIWDWPAGSGEIWGYRTDSSQPASVRAACTPRVRADQPIGSWNRFHITLVGDRLTVVLNGSTVIENARLPGIPESGPIVLQHHGNAMEFTNLFIRELHP